MFRNKFWLVMGICLMVVLSSSDAFAWHRDGPREVVVVGHNRYHYHDGRFYRPGWFGFDFVVVAPPIGAVIKILPPRHNVIIVRGVRYYHYENVYYMDCPGGYMVVTPPIVVTLPIGTVVKTLPPGYETIIVKDAKYYYCDNVYYTDCPGGYIVVAPPIGAVIKVLPPGYNTIVVKDVKYYYYDNVYYTDCPGGYILVPAPATTPDVVTAPAGKAAPAEQPQAPSGETVVINIPNASGGYTPVTLVKDKDGYIGPQGEYYQGHPTVDQLKVLYGD